MSFLLRTSAVAFRTATAPAAAARFSTALRAQKSAADAAKDTLKTVDRKVSDAAVTGIEAGERAAAKVKQATNISSGEAKGKADELSGQAKGKAHELSGQAKGKAEELTGQAKGKAEELRSEMNKKMS